MPQPKTLEHINLSPLQMYHLLLCICCINCMAINSLHSFSIHQKKEIGIFFLHPGDVWVSLSGTIYQNNSLVTLEDIGENDTALLCETNFTACCRQPETGETWFVSGNWFFPNKTRVPNVVVNETIALMWDFYRDRDQSVVRMKRRRGGEDGIYRCMIPDSTNVTQTIYIGVYTANAGEV